MLTTFINTYVKSDYPPNCLMSYCGSSSTPNEVSILKSEVAHCTNNMSMLDAEIVELKNDLRASREQLKCARFALHDVTNQKKTMEKKELCEKKLKRSQKMRSQLVDELATSQIDNIDLALEIDELEEEMRNMDESDKSDVECVEV